MSNFSRMGRRNRFAAPIGGIFIILCLVGLVTVVMLCFNLTRDILDNSGKKHEYERMLLPVVMFDPAPFEDPVNFDSLSLLQSSIWATLLGENRDNYEQDDNLMLVVPASDVDVTAYNLFGPDVTLSHGSFGDYEISYLYDESTKSYHVPVDVMTPSYTPQVEEIDKQGSVLRLRVGYVPPSSVMDITFTEKGITNSTTPVKYMTYELHEGRNGYYLYAVRDVEGATFITGSDAVLPDAIPGQVSSVPVSDVLPETVPGGGASSEGSSSDGGSSSEDGSSDEGSSSQDGDSQEEEDAGDSGEESEESSEPSSAPELEG